MDLGFLWAYPVATLSSAAIYGLLIALAIPSSRSTLEPLLLRPVAPHQRYLQAFDGFRGMAAALVAIGHCWWATHPVFHSTQLTFSFIAYGAKAVPIFAVLSGFLIYRSVLSVRTLADLRGYVIRRFFRIYPVYLLSVALCVWTGQYVSNQSFTGPGYFIADLFLLNVINWPGGFANPVTWSLYVEVAFYALLPLVVLTVEPKRMRVFALVAIVALIIADYPSRVFGLWKFFLMGIIAAEYEPKMRKFAIPAVILGMILLVLDFRSPYYNWFANLGFTAAHQDGETVGLGLACVLLLMAVPHLPTLASALNILPFRLLGMISYSLYIVHFFYIKANFPEIALFTSLGTTASYEHFKSLPSMPWWYLPFVFFPGVFLWALVSYVVIERPGIVLGARLARQQRVPPPVALPETARATVAN